MRTFLTPAFLAAYGSVLYLLYVALPTRTKEKIAMGWIVFQWAVIVVMTPVIVLIGHITFARRNHGHIRKAPHGRKNL